MLAHVLWSPAGFSVFGAAAPAWLHQVEGREKGFRLPHTIAALCTWPKEPSGGILAQGNDGYVFSPP